ncbi:MAG: invasion protein CiaB [Epsilonproteobacteria bacterium]|nr:hypothetical protein [Campylobacterota bacterium]NPA57144.1 invasion protein CiaB [Campylobacterota bacterium]
MVDLERLYALLEDEERDLYLFYDFLNPRREIPEEKALQIDREIDSFLDFIGIARDRKSTLAAINRIAGLREDMLLRLISSYDEEKQIEIRERAYVWVSRFYIARFERLIERIEREGVVSPFYLTLFRHAHLIGKVFSDWQSSWTAEIVHGINRELFRIFNGDEERIYEMLASKGLLDKGHGGRVADRCYSLLRMRSDGSFERLSYAQAFREEVERAASALLEAIEELDGLEDGNYNQKREWISYLEGIYRALVEENPDRLVERWAEVDRRWMAITTPIQIGHPLEYYEDRYRRAVALEWDLRVMDPHYPQKRRIDYVTAAFRELYREIDLSVPSIFDQTLAALSKVQLYIGRPMLFYGSEFNGLFSAQVVPNDEVVSKEYGKKIFAYPDMVLAIQRAKPKLLIGTLLYGDEFYERFRRILNEPEVWHEIYDITTIGHELGHILWIDGESEGAMNASGQFKNLEEFKATVGGLVSYFLYEEDRLWDYLLEDTIVRVVSLLNWMEIDEVQPYYVEGLLHLEGLFESGVLAFDGTLQIDLSRWRYEALKEWYLHIYSEIARHYLLKEDSKRFLDRFIEYDQHILPRNRNIREFVHYYYQLYQKVGMDIIAS